MPSTRQSLAKYRYAIVLTVGLIFIILFWQWRGLRTTTSDSVNSGKEVAKQKSTLEVEVKPMSDLAPRNTILKKAGKEKIKVEEEKDIKKNNLILESKPVDGSAY